MAIKNRDEAGNQVDAKIVPTVTNAIHRDLLKEDILNSIVFRKDVIKTIPANTQQLTELDYSDCDLIYCDISGYGIVDFNISGLADGDLKYLKVEKTISDGVNWNQNISNVSENSWYLMEKATTIYYQIYKKTGIIFVKAINRSIYEARITDFDNDIAYTYITPRRFNEVFPDYFDDKFNSDFPNAFDARLTNKFPNELNNNMPVTIEDGTLTNNWEQSWIKITKAYAGYKDSKVVHVYNLTAHLDRGQSSGSTSIIAEFSGIDVAGWTGELLIPAVDIYNNNLGYVRFTKNGADKLQLDDGNIDLTLVGSEVVLNATFFSFDIGQ